MRIAISCHPTQGGSGVVATELAMGLAGRGHEVHLVSLDRPFRLCNKQPVHFHRVTIADYPLFKHPPHDLCLANKLAEVIEKHDIQVVHAHYAVPHAISAMLAAQSVRPHPVRVVTTLHGTDITLVGSHRDFYRICRHAMTQCDGLTTVSRWLSDETVKTFKLTEDPVVIPNFVDCERFSAMGRAPYPTDGQPLRLMHASNFRPVKRVFDVIRVFEKISKQLPATLDMVGDGPLLGMAEELAGELGLCDRVSFHGPQTDMATHYRAAHAYLLLSDYESFGLSALEAMACGTPVLATCAGGLVEVVEDGVTGALRPVGDIDAMAAAGLDILRDADRWAAMSVAAAARAKAAFCKDALIGAYEAFYQRVIDQPASKS